MRQVPEKTIVYIPVIPNDGIKEFDMNISTFLRPLNLDHKRYWFTPNFYRCLPLSIGNMQGFVFSFPFDFTVKWNGGIGPEDIEIFDVENYELEPEMNHVYVTTEFGHGIFTAHFPVMLKTPPGINLMTIAPPNFPTPGVSPMTGVVETDNLKFTFTLNFKVDLVNIPIKIEKNYPLMGIIPIPRNFCDSFEMINAYDILDKEYIEEERAIAREHANRRDIQNAYEEGSDGLYYKGVDIRGNKFKDHQLPNSAAKVRRKREE